MSKLLSKLGGKRSGFTLIELLVVIAIIGVLASIVLASLNTARQKSRDARRISDINQIRLALELFYNSNSVYPDTQATLYAADATGKTSISPVYIPTVPYDPQGTAVQYVYCSTAAKDTYHLGANLEDINNSVLANDRDIVTDNCASGGFDGTDPATPTSPGTCAPTASKVAGKACYDVTP